MRAASLAPRFFKTPVPSVRVNDNQVIQLAGRDWIGLHTPGHTEDHLCLYDPTEGVMLSGDHVLPTITPHIGGLDPHGDPLLDFFESLDKVAAYGPDVKSCCRPTGTRSTISRRGPRRSRSTTSSASTCCVGPPTSSGARRACRSCRRTCSRPGPRARWPTARRSPTSSTCAGPASSNGASCADGYQYVKPG